MTEQDHFKHLNENETYLTEDDWPKVDALLDYLNDQRINDGYKMANPVQHMEDMKLLMRGKPPAWRCEAGEHSLIIRTDGTLAPCFPMYSATRRLGRGRRSQIRPQPAQRDEGRVLEALPLDLQLHSRLLLRHETRAHVGPGGQAP